MLQLNQGNIWNFVIGGLFSVYYNTDIARLSQYKSTLALLLLCVSSLVCTVCKTPAVRAK